MSIAEKKKTYSEWQIGLLTSDREQAVSSTAKLLIPLIRTVIIGSATFIRWSGSRLAEAYTSSSFPEQLRDIWPIASHLSYSGFPTSGVLVFAKLLGPLQRWRDMETHKSFLVSYCVVLTAATGIPSSISPSFIIACALAKSRLLDKSSIRVEARRRRLT